MKSIKGKTALSRAAVFCAAMIMMLSSAACDSKTESSSKTEDSKPAVTVSQSADESKTDSNDSSKSSTDESVADSVAESETDSNIDSTTDSKPADDSSEAEKLGELNTDLHVIVAEEKGNPDSGTLTYSISDINERISWARFTDEEIEKAKTAIANGTKYFGDSDESYSELDEYGRPRSAMTLLSKNTMPAEDEKRGPIGMIKPICWHTVKYPELIKDKYLYNRCHIIGWQLAGENANEKNLLTGTRQLNVDGMLPCENEVAEYIRRTGNHVLYRSSPVYKGEEKLCRGVLIEARSIEDDEINFMSFSGNSQKGIAIDYRNGKSKIKEDTDMYLVEDVTIFDSEKTQATAEESNPAEMSFVIDTKEKMIHKADCGSVKSIASNSKEEFTGSEVDVLSMYEECSLCEKCLEN